MSKSKSRHGSAGLLFPQAVCWLACVKDHLNLKSDPADWCPVLRNPYSSDVLSQLATFRNIEPERCRLPILCALSQVGYYSKG